MASKGLETSKLSIYYTLHRKHLLFHTDKPFICYTCCYKPYLFDYQLKGK